jgi:hypothetical protein
MFWKNNIDSCHVCDKKIFFKRHIKLYDIVCCFRCARFFDNSSWIIFTEVTNNSDNSARLVYLWDFHLEVWQKNQIPSFITNSYSIINESIFTTSKLFIRSTDYDFIVSAFES